MFKFLIFEQKKILAQNLWTRPNLNLLWSI